MTLRTYRAPRRQSARAKATEQILADARPRVFKRDGWRCMIGFSPDCTGQAEDLHHIRSRAQGGGHDDANLLAACRYCHNWTHQHPALAREAGVIV